MSCMLRYVSSSLTGNLSQIGRTHPARAPSEAHFFVQRFEVLTDNTSQASWSPLLGVRFERGPQYVNTMGRRLPRRLCHFEQLIAQPELFPRPLWHVDCTTLAGPSMLLLDVWIDVEVLRDCVRNGAAISARRMFIESTRYIRHLAASHDCSDSRDNFVAHHVWRSMRATEYPSLQSLDDIRHLCEACHVDESECTLETVRTALYECQNVTVRKMITLEAGTRYQPAPRDTIRVGAGGFEVFIGEHDRLRDGRPQPVAFRGGYLANTMGSGKTLCVIAASEHSRPLSSTVKRPSATLVVCPSQVVQHWVQELKKHVRRDLIVRTVTTRREISLLTYADIRDADYVIVSFNFFGNPHFREFLEHYSPTSAFTERCVTYTQELDRVPHSDLARRSNPFLLYFHWRRVVVDEFHELDTLAPNCVSHAVFAMSADVRWMLSGSPFINAASLVRSLRYFIWPDGWHDYGTLTHILSKHMVLVDTCRPPLPRLVEEVIWTTMSPTERSIYDSLAPQGRAQQLRACSSVGITAIVQNAPVSVDSVDAMHSAVKSHMTQAKIKVQERLAEVRLIRDSLEGTDTWDSARLAQLQRETCAEEGRLLQRAVDIEGSLNALDINITHVEDQECSVCLTSMRDEIAVIKSCGHAFCKECLSVSLSRYSRCPLCRASASMTSQSVVVLSTVTRTFEQQMSARYGSKMARLLRYINTNQHHKIIIFSQWDDFLKDVAHVVKQQAPVLFCKGSAKQRQCNIDRFRSSPEHNILMLSTLHSGSGCDLTVADTVIMLDIVDGPDEYVMNVERQAISRCYRVGQEKNVTVVRFIAKDTLESEVYFNTYAHFNYVSFYRTT